MSTRQQSSWRRALGLVAAAAACLLAVLLTGGPASAHAELIGTDPAEGAVLPASPGQVTLTFNERVLLTEAQPRLLDAAGRQLTSTASASERLLRIDVPDDLEAGSYVVAWRVVSADGHPIAGSLTFSVGKASAQVAPAPVPQTPVAVTRGLSIVQAVLYLGLLPALGLGVFLVLLLPADTRADGPRRLLRRLLVGAAATAAVAGVLSVPFTVADQQADSLGDVLRPGTWGDAQGSLLLSLGLLLAGLAAVVVARTRVVLLVGVGLAAVAPALVGHARALEPQWPLVLTDVAHVLAGSAWLGGLIGLAVTLPAIAGQVGRAATVLSRFSAVAAGTLAALLASGSLLAWRIVGSWGDLFGTSYGRLLVVKIGLVGLAVGVASYNRFVLVPRARADGGYDARQRATVRIGRVVLVEAGLLAAVLVLTGFLVNRPPGNVPHGLPEEQVQVARLAGHGSVRVTLDPGLVGRNELAIRLQTPAGRPLEGDLPVVSLQSGDLSLGPVPLQIDGAGRFRAEVVLPEAGTWEVEVSQRLGRFDNPVARVRFQVGPRGGAT